MIQAKQVLFIVIAFAVLGLGATIGYGMGMEKGKQSESKKLDELLTKYTLLPRSEFITSWRATTGGIVKKVSPKSIIVENEEQLSELFFAEDVIVERNFIKDGNVVNTAQELSVKDIKEGEAINVVVSASPQGDLTVKKVVIVTPQ